MQRTLLLALLVALSASAEPKKRENKLVGLSVLDVKIGTDTFRTLKQKVGPSALRPVRNDETHPPLYMCYRTPSGRSWFWFHSGDRGDWSRIDTLMMAAHPLKADEQCAMLPETAEDAAYGKLKVGLTHTQVAKLLGDKVCGSDECRLSETREGQTLTAVVAFKNDVVDSILIWEDDAP